MNIFLLAFTALILSFTVLSLVRNDYWTFRIFDYPRLQKFALSILCISLLILFYDGKDTLYWICLIAVSINIFYLTYQIFPFTPLGKKQVLRADEKNPDQSISLMISNVYQYNRNSKGCLKEIKKANPDVVFLLETDQRWKEETDDLDKTYPYSKKVPLENTYGMLLYSKLELTNTEVKYIVEDKIPSIHTNIILKNGTAVMLYGVHPTPPSPTENIRSTERDKELLLVADMVKEQTDPVIVIGDLNDVAWSHSTKLFLKMSGLLDPRRGRGFYNSFHAWYPFLRFPLDHAFISTDFKLKKMKRFSNYGSDHFPIYISLQHQAKAEKEQHSMSYDEEDIEEAEEKRGKNNKIFPPLLLYGLYFKCYLSTVSLSVNFI